MTCIILWSSPPKTRNMSNVHSLHDFKNMHFHGFYLLTMNHPSWILPCLSDIQFVKNICDWLTEWLTDWVTDWLTDWVTCPILERLAPLKTWSFWKPWVFEKPKVLNLEFSKKNLEFQNLEFLKNLEFLEKPRVFKT